MKSRERQIEAMITGFRRTIAYLNIEIAKEERRTNNHDINHFAYSTLAKAQRQRRDNLLNSIAQLEAKLEPLEAAPAVQAESGLGKQAA